MAKTKSTTKSKAKTGAATGVAKRSHSEEVRELIIEARDQIESGYIGLSQLLSEAYHKEFYTEWGFGTFEEYCNAELDVNYRKSMYLVEIWDKVKSLNLPRAKVDKLGWTKMKDIATVITKENAKEWLDNAAKMTSREVSEAVSIVRRSEKGQEPRPATTKMTFVMGEGEANIVLDALAEAKKLTESENDVLALELICQEWLSDKEAVPDKTSLEDQVSYLETIYGVDITVTKAAETSETNKKAKEVLEKAGEGTAKKGKTTKGSKKEETPDSGQDINSLLGID